MKSLGQVLDEHRGLGPGFDFLRVALAVAIVGMHAPTVSGYNQFMLTPLWFGGYALVPMFFALSGFLITASAQRLSLKNFLINRGMRIVPALAVDVVFCALIVGPLITTEPLSAYFQSPLVWSYFLNILGYIHYQLPGVFAGHPTSQVNGALWTVPWEIGCYAVIAALMVTRLIHRPALVLAMVVAYLALGAGLQLMFSGQPVDGPLRRAIGLTGARGALALAAFLLGILIYQLRYRIAYSRMLFAAAVAVCAATALIGDKSLLEVVWTRFFLLPLLVYITVFVGLTRVPIPGYFKRGDYSYGIYLYHLPLLQLIVALFPGVIEMGGWGAILVFFAGVPFVVLFATASWHLIEKPVLGLRKKFSFVARVRGIDVDPDNNAAPTPQASDVPSFAGAER